jgi:hypothetical protein
MEGQKLRKIFPETEEIMKSLINIISSKEEMKVELFKKSFQVVNSANWNSHINEINGLKNNYCNGFINSLRKLKFTKSIIELTKINEKFGFYDFDTFKNEFIILIDTIDDYTETQNNINEFNKIEEVYNNVTKVTNLYEKMIANINKIDELIKLVSPEIEECKFKIRFMKEDKSLDSLKDNIILIENIYNNVNKLIGNNEDELRYCRAESGSLLLWLTGSVATLTTMLPILEFGYKVYSEQLSPKAKLEIQLKQEELNQAKAKTRGEYLRFILAYKKSSGIKSLNLQDDNEIQTIMSEIDDAVRELFSKNPYIKLNDLNLGLSEISNKEISIELLKEAVDNTLLLSELDDGEYFDNTIESNTVNIIEPNLE